MRTFLSLFVALFVFSSFSYGQTVLGARAIDTSTIQNTIQTGYVVVTPISGTGTGLSVSEVFSNRSGNNLFQSSVVASPPVTSTAVVVNSDPIRGLNTGIAIVNPHDIAAIVTLTVRNNLGVTTATRTINIPARQQISRFVTEHFAGEAAFAAAFTGLLFISSNIPVGVMGIAFEGASFTSLPVATQLSNVNNINTAALTSAVTAVPSAGIPLTGASAPLVGATGQITTTPTPPPTPTVTVVTPTLLVFPLIGTGIGGTNALMLPQFAAGGGWTTQVTIANTTPSSQTVRVDFFNSNGGPLNLPFGATLTNVVVPPGGVVVLSSQL